MKVMYIFLTTLFLLLNSCESLLGYKNLGKGYFLYKEGNKTDIIYNDNPNEGRLGNGFPIIPATVTKVGFNEHYIIAQSTDYKTKSKHFWIIEKDNPLSIKKCLASENFDNAIKSNVTGPLDLTSFLVQLDKKGIDLQFN
jgi:hypothetical protein